MSRSIHTLRRQVAGLALAAALAVVVAPQALAGSGLDGRSPDTRDAAIAAHRQQRSTAVLDGRSPDTRDAARIAHASPYGPPDGWYGYAVSLTNANRTAPVLDGRSPDTRDAARLAHSPVVTITRSPGFEWGDFWIGVAAAIGAMSLLAVSTRLLAARNGRKQPSPVATA